MPEVEVGARQDNGRLSVLIDGTPQPALPPVERASGEIGGATLEPLSPLICVFDTHRQRIETLRQHEKRVSDAVWGIRSLQPSTGPRR